MVVYVELAIFNNFVVSMVLLLLTKRVCLAEGKFYRIILSCLFSSGLSLVFPLISQYELLTLTAKILTGILCVAIAFKTKHITKLVKYFLTYLGLTLAFGGVVYAVYNIFNLNLSEAKFANSTFILAVLAIYIILFAFVFNVFYFAKMLNKHKKASAFVYKVKLTINNKTYSTCAFLDSGNRLKDNSGEGINIVTYSFLSKFLPPDSLTSIITNSLTQVESDIPIDVDLKDAHFVEYSSVGANRQKMFVFSANSIEIENGKTFKKLESPRLGVMFKKFADSIDYDILLSGDIATKL